MLKLQRSKQLLCQAQFPHYLPDPAFPDKATVLGSHMISVGYVRRAQHLQNPLCWLSRAPQLKSKVFKSHKTFAVTENIPNLSWEVCNYYMYPQFVKRLLAIACFMPILSTFSMEIQHFLMEPGCILKCICLAFGIFKCLLSDLALNTNILLNKFSEFTGFSAWLPQEMRTPNT